MCINFSDLVFPANDEPAFRSGAPSRLARCVAASEREKQPQELEQVSFCLVLSLSLTFFSRSRFLSLPISVTEVDK